MTYEKSFKEEAVRLSDEIGIKKAGEQLGISYNTLSDWRYKRKQHGIRAYVGSEPFPKKRTEKTEKK